MGQPKIEMKKGVNYSRYSETWKNTLGDTSKVETPPEGIGN